MRENDGRQLAHQSLGALRIRTVRQVEAGEVSVPETARSLGMSKTAVYNRMAAYRRGGLEALKARPVPGKTQTDC